MKNSLELRAGEWVQVRSKAEILRTLDKNGRLEGLPCMPEMFKFCGKRFRVFKRAHKTCDPPNGMGGRRMTQAVHLEELRCTGDAHGGCQARCLIFWKEAWLQRVEQGTEVALPSPASLDQQAAPQGCAEKDVLAGTRNGDVPSNPDETVYVCQSTHLSEATQPIRWWDLRQYLEDYTSGNVGLSRILFTCMFFLYTQLVSAGMGLGAGLRWVYNTLQRMRGGTPYPMRFGMVPRGTRTPSAKLDLKPGELVKIRGLEEILATVDERNNNRGMSFDPEMVPYCGGEYRVLNRVNQLINEKTGKMQYLKNDCIMLDEVVCRACYSKHRRFCPRSIYPYWREIWLDRVEETSLAAESKR